jgi:hypothetical protein
LYCDPNDGSKLSERGKLITDESNLAERGILPSEFQGTVEFYDDVESTVGYEVHHKGEEPFVDLGFSSLRGAIEHFLRFGSKLESELKD